MTSQQIREAVRVKYPQTEKERQGCVQEIQRMNELRKIYKQRLLNDSSTKTGIQ